MTFWKMLELITNGHQCKKLEWVEGHYICKKRKDIILECITDPYTRNITERQFTLSDDDFEYDRWITIRSPMPKKGRMLSDIIFDDKLNKRIWIREDDYNKRRPECMQFKVSENEIKPIYCTIEAPNCFVNKKLLDLTQNSLLASDWIEYIPEMSKDLFDIVSYKLNDIDLCFSKLKDSENNTAAFINADTHKPDMYVKIKGNGEFYVYHTEFIRYEFTLNCIFLSQLLSNHDKYEKIMLYMPAIIQ